jgi:hypothetical protein
MLLRCQAAQIAFHLIVTKAQVLCHRCQQHVWVAAMRDMLLSAVLSALDQVAIIHASNQKSVMHNWTWSGCCGLWAMGCSEQLPGTSQAVCISSMSVTVHPTVPLQSNNMECLWCQSTHELSRLASNTRFSVACTSELQGLPASV